MLVHPDQLRANLGLEGREGEFDKIAHYGCVQCQTLHWEGEPYYEDHKFFMAKHGTMYVTWTYYRKLWENFRDTEPKRQTALKVIKEGQGDAQ